MVIFCFLEMPSGLFSIFYHLRLAKTSKKKADDAALSFILGVEIFTTLIWLLTYFIIFTLFTYNTTIITSPFLWTMSGICFAEAIIMAFFYFRQGKSTALFIPRRVAKSLITHAEKTKSRSDAIMLGFISCLPELLFTLPIYIVCSVLLQGEDFLPRTFIIILSVLIVTAPLFIIRTFYHAGHNLADITRIRTRLKIHFRIILALAYIALSLALVNLAIINS